MLYIRRYIRVFSNYIVSSSEQPCNRNILSMAVIFIPKNRKEDELWHQQRNFRQVHGVCRFILTLKKYRNQTALQKKKRVYKSFTSDIAGPKGKRACEKQAADWAANKERYTEHEDLTVGQAVSSYIQSKTHVLSESTLTGYKVIQKNYLTDITNERLSLLTTIKVQKWVNSLSSTVSVKTVKNAYGLFNAAVSSFSDLHFKINFPQKKQEDIYIPSDKDIKTLLLNSKDDLQIAIYLGAFAGLRRGEICALEDADVLNGYIRINKSMGKTESNGWKIKPPKTESSNRNVYLPEFLIDILKGKTGRIVSLTPDQITDRFGTLRNNLNMPRFRFHDLRHYYVSVNHALGVPDQYIMSMGGWSTDRTMKAVYRNILIPEKDKFAKLSLNHFDNMQHEMQHENKKAQ